MQNFKHLSLRLFACMLVVMTFSSCYNHRGARSGILAGRLHYTEKQKDSLSFESSHHYTKNYNFVVKADSLMLHRQQPEEMLTGLLTDSFAVHRDDHLVVADIRFIPSDKVDSVWIEVARDQATMGWIHESRLLPNVVPDDPISQFISTFSDTHLLIFLIVICIIGFGYVLRKMMKHNEHIVHFRDIDSFYPTLLTIIVATAASFYAAIQTFCPELWHHFYFHPTLNPFSVPAILAAFLVLVWAMLIVALAAMDDVRHRLPFGEAVFYLCGLAAVCAVDYIIFSITTLYYIGYLLLIAYVAFALYKYFSHSRTSCLCGNCGARLHRKGRCPYCGAMNN